MTVDALAARQTGFSDQAAVQLDRRSRLSTALPTLITAGLVALCPSIADQGTQIHVRHDLRGLMAGTSLRSVALEGPLTPFTTPTRMAQIRGLAPLSLREWASVFGVSHSAISQWENGDDPDRQKLDRVLSALNAAAGHHSELGSWLVRSLPGMETRPLDLLREDRWRAFNGAIRARSAPALTTPTEELIQKRQQETSWAVTERPIEADEA